MRRFAPLAAVLLGCQDYNLAGSSDVGGKYNPPDLSVEAQEDRITQVTVPAVDVLWVVDNSCSMEEEQRALRDNFGSFMQYFTGSGMDYHVGVVSTDMDARQESGKLIEDDNRSSRYIDDTLSADDAIESFRQRALLGTAGSGTERGKDAAMAALTTERYDTNAGYYRDEASLSIVVISDEHDQSNVSVNEFVNWIEGLKTDDDYTVSFSSIVGLDNSCSAAERGTGYLEVTNQVGGIDWSICTEDWSEVLTELGLAAAGLKQEFFLSLVPDESTIAVTVEDPDGTVTPYVVGTDWTYSRPRNSISFTEFTPSPLSVVSITYEVLASNRVGDDDTTEGGGDTAGE
jgi:hypothetical protein